jgi:hypothetical protein
VNQTLRTPGLLELESVTVGSGTMPIKTMLESVEAGLAWASGTIAASLELVASAHIDAPVPVK